LLTASCFALADRLGAMSNAVKCIR
jgi:hypothetical protein